MSDETMKRPERDELLNTLRGGGGGFMEAAMRKLIHTANELDATLAKATRMWTDDMLSAGQQLSATKSSNKRLRAQRTELQRELGALVETLQRMEAVSSFGDQVYAVREREMEGWDGPDVTAWGEGCELVTEMIAKYGNHEEPDTGEDDANT